MTTTPTVEESLKRVLKTRMGVHLRKNLDGTFAVTVQLNNPRRARKAISMRGYSLSEVLNLAAAEYEAAVEACEIIP